MRSVRVAAHLALRVRGRVLCADNRTKGQGRMIRVVSWNIFKKWPPWRVLVEMARQGEADVALLQEAGSPPPDLAHPVPCGTDEFWKGRQHEGRPIYDRWSLVVQLSDRVEVEWFRAVPPISHLGEHDIAISGIGDNGRGKGDTSGSAGVSIGSRFRLRAPDETSRGLPTGYPLKFTA